jgi:heme/copper-type cytochrome/quinol oxidase subunit 4
MSIVVSRQQLTLNLTNLAFALVLVTYISVRFEIIFCFELTSINCFRQLLKFVKQISSFSYSVFNVLSQIFGLPISLNLLHVSSLVKSLGHLVLKLTPARLLELTFACVLYFNT